LDAATVENLADGFVAALLELLGTVKDALL
jgi:hypothetical protein